MSIAAPLESENVLAPFPAVGRPSRVRYRLVVAGSTLIPVVLIAAHWHPHGADALAMVPSAAWIVTAILMFVTAGRRRFEVTDEGVEFVGIVRRVQADWSDVEWVGWFTDLGTAFSGTEYRLMFRVRGHRMPYWELVVAASIIAAQHHTTVTSIKHQMQLALEDRNVRYRERIPDMSETRFWALQASIFALVFILLPITIVSLTR